MKREDIRAAINAVVAEYGIGDLVEWPDRPPALRVLVGGHIWLISARAGMSKKALGFELGKLDTLARVITGKWPAEPKLKTKFTPGAAMRQTDLEEFTGAQA